MKNSAFIVVILFWSVISSLYSQSFTQTGKASFYANKFENKITASGEVYKHSLPTAAHKTLPFGTMIKVTNLSNNKTAIVKINDRGPFVENRIIDVSKSVAIELDFVNDGITEVKIEVIEDQEDANNTSKTDREIETTTISNIDITTNVITSDSDKTEKQQTIAIEQKNLITPQVSTTYYSLNAIRTIPKGFGVQIASYQESANLIERVSVVANELKQNVTIQIVNSGGTRIYRLIVGEFESRAKAEYFKDSIKSSYQGFVVVF